MDTTSFQRVDFDAVLEILAERAASPAARRALRALRPWTRPEALEAEWAAVEELLRFLDAGGAVALGDFDDCGGLLEELAVPGTILEAPRWLELRRFLALDREVLALIEREAGQLPRCQDRLGWLEPLTELAGAIDKVFDAEGGVRDAASPDLRDIRKRLAGRRREIERLCERLLDKYRDLLQDAYWTERGGRRVLPVRSGSKGRLQGIAHAGSASGETVFLEPFEMVEPANHLSQDEDAERREIGRILEALSERGRAFLPALERHREGLVQLDLWLARARLAHEHGLRRPEIVADAPLRLVRAHHPLLFFHDPRRSVPMDLRLEPENRALIVTGPNTGGKTTALKTVALLALMAQCAIPLPAASETRLPLFDQVLAELGDDQNVSQGLSTFSAHVRRIRWILEHCGGGGALVLLDELGKATDPVQAGALGRAIVEALIARGALVFVTTHLGTLKDWAQEHPQGRNASFRLDPESRRPRYEIQLDTPGLSEAFTIARAEGLPPEIVDAALEQLPAAERDLAALLETLHEKQQRLEQERRSARNAKKRSNQARREYRRLRRELDLEETRHERDFAAEYRELLEQARRDLESRIANLPSRQALSRAREQIAADQQAARERLEALQRREAEILEQDKAPEPEQAPPWRPAEGDWVTVGEGNQKGRIIELDTDKGRARLEVGSLALEAGIADLRPAQAPERPAAASGGIRYGMSRTAPWVPPEIDIHGQRVEPALERLDKYLDSALLCHHEQVRIVHGHGTGALRAATHEFLDRHPLVRGYRLAPGDAGGAAVTLARLGGK